MKKYVKASFSTSAKSKIFDWLYEHEQAADDCLHHFKVNFLEEIFIEDVLGWMYEHPQLWKDFSARFPKEAKKFENEELY